MRRGCKTTLFAVRRDVLWVGVDVRADSCLFLGEFIDRWGGVAIISLTFSLFSDYMLARDQAGRVIEKRIRGR